MARTPNTNHDEKITASIAQGARVSTIAAELSVSEPTVYNAIRRLGLTLPSRASAVEPAAPPAVTKRTRTSSPASAKAGAGRTRKRPAAPASPAVTKASATTRPAKAGRVSKSVAKASPDPTVVVADAAVTPGVALVAVPPDSMLLTVRVDKGVELLKNLSARIVRHERELAAAKQRYADTLASLALS